MRLSDILRKISVTESLGDMQREISGVNMDSRQVEHGDLFVAVKGTQTDGHAYIAKAIAQGAKAILQSEPFPDNPVPGVTYVRVADTEDAVGKAATQFYNDPTGRLKLVGVTGTNGKTTIATVLYNMFRSMGYKCGLCSTVCNFIDGRAIEADHTTPDPITLNKLLAQMADEGCEYAFMECSSHAIHQKRIGGLRFVGGIFTNLTRDHLDYHKTFDNYRDAKKAFFDMLPRGAFAITNADDRNGMVMVPEDRKLQGIIPRMSVGRNIAVGSLDALTGFLGHIDTKREAQIGIDGKANFNIKTPNLEKSIVELSGGNQQKAIVARWLTTKPKVLILDEPTKGIDVGAKSEFYNMICEFARQGIAVILISSELPEVIGLSDRIIVMRGRRIVGEIQAIDATEEKLLTMAMMEE